MNDLRPHTNYVEEEWIAPFYRRENGVSKRVCPLPSISGRARILNPKLGCFPFYKSEFPINLENSYQAEFSPSLPTHTHHQVRYTWPPPSSSIPAWSHGHIIVPSSIHPSIHTLFAVWVPGIPRGPKNPVVNNPDKNLYPCGSYILSWGHQKPESE